MTDNEAFVDGLYEIKLLKRAYFRDNKGESGIRKLRTLARICKSKGDVCVGV